MMKAPKTFPPTSGLGDVAIFRVTSARTTADIQRTGIAAGGIFYNVQPGTAAQLKK
jgi:hypothetical protein